MKTDVIRPAKPGIEGYHQTMVAKLAKPGDDILATMTVGRAHLLHMAVGMAGEAAEISSALEESGNFTDNLDIANLIEELGDMEFYVEGIVEPYDLRDRIIYSDHAMPVGNYGLSKAVALLAIVAGEALDTVKKHVIYNQDLDLGKLASQLNRVHRHMAVIRVWIPVTRSQVLQANCDKLAARYPGYDYSDGAAKERADKADDPHPNP